MKAYPEFDVFQLLEPYNGINSEILNIQKKFFDHYINNYSIKTTNKEYESLLIEIDKTEKYPKFIFAASNIKSYVVALTLSSINKKIKKIKIYEHPAFEKNTITIHYNNSFKLTDFENELLLKNYKFEGHFFKNPKTYKIGEKSGIELSKQFNLSRIPTEIFVEGIIAETDSKYLLYGKNISYWVYKEDVEDLYKTQWNEIQLDITTLNSLNLKKFELFPFQIEGVKFLCYEKTAFLLFDQGMGKTITSICAAINANAKNVLVITLASLKVNWKREIEAMQQTAKIISSNNWDEKSTRFTIINYDILKNFHKFPPKGRKPKDWVPESILLDQKFDAIILDEGHKCKSQKSIRSKIVNVLTKSNSIKYVWVLSGTLIEKNEDFFNVCKVINCGIKNLIITNNSALEWNNYNEFQTRYCNKIKIKKNGVEFFITPKIKNQRIENSNTYELHQRSKHKIYRVLKSNELQGFVSKHRIPLYFELEEKEKKKYDILFSEYLKEREERGITTSEDASKLIESLKLRQYLADIKVPHTVALAKSFFEDEEKVIIFTNFKSEFEKIVKKLGDKAVCVNASFSQEKNQKAIDEFQNNEKILAIVGNISTLGTGHNLTKGDNVIINSPNWNSGEHAQAEDRAWRLGRSEDVNVYYPLFEETEEEIVFQRSENKKENKQIFFNE